MLTSRVKTSVLLDEVVDLLDRVIGEKILEQIRQVPPDIALQQIKRDFILMRRCKNTLDGPTDIHCGVNQGAV
jgi:hypothetical protein